MLPYNEFLTNIFYFSSIVFMFFVGFVLRKVPQLPPTLEYLMLISSVFIISLDVIEMLSNSFKSEEFSFLALMLGYLVSYLFEKIWRGKNGTTAGT